MYPYISFFGKTIGSYGLLMAVAVVLAGALAVRKAPRYGLAGADMLIVGATACGVGLLAGNLLYIAVTYDILQILQLLASGQVTLLFGGLVFYGSLLGGILGTWIGTKIAGCKMEAAIGAAVVYVPLGHAIGRIGCLLAGCCYGCAYDGPLAIHYANSIAGLSPQQGYFPTQPLEALCNLGIFLILRSMEKRNIGPRKLLVAYLGLYSAVRFSVEMLRGDSLRGIYGGISVSQWISLALGVGSGIFWLISSRKRLPRAN